MTHAECIEALVTRLREGARAPSSVPWPPEIEIHLADCSDCWAVVELLHESASGAPHPEQARMAQLFGCERVRDRFHVLVELSPSERTAREPAASRHLGWCLACRDRFVTFAEVETDAGAAAWSLANSAAVRSLQAFHARVVVVVRRGLAGFRELEGLIALPALAPMATRGSDATAGDLLDEVQFRPKDGGLAADLRVHARSDGRVDLAVRLHGDVPPGTMLWLHTADNDEVVAGQTAHTGAVTLFSAVPAGRYVLVLPNSPPSHVAIDVEPVDA